MIAVNIRTAPGLNAREHWRQRAKRVQMERQSVAWALIGKPKPQVPCTVRLTRSAPSNGLDDDNLAGSMKAVRDAVADWLGVDDKHAQQVRYVYGQQRGPWAVLIEFGEPCEAPEFRAIEVVA